MTGKMEIPLLKTKKQFPNTADSYVVIFVKCERPRGFKEDGINRTFDMREVTDVFEYRSKEYKAFLQEELDEVERQRREEAKEAERNRVRNEKRSHLIAIQNFKLSEQEKAYIFDNVDDPKMPDKDLDKLDLTDLEKRTIELEKEAAG